MTQRIGGGGIEPDGLVEGEIFFPGANLIPDDLPKAKRMKNLFGNPSALGCTPLATQRAGGGGMDPSGSAKGRIFFPGPNLVPGFFAEGKKGRTQVSERTAKREWVVEHALPPKGSGSWNQHLRNGVPLREISRNFFKVTICPKG